MVERKKILVSFSGGRTSAFMLYWVWLNLRDRYDIIVVFANTGKEVEGTLEFINQCSRAWSIPIVWVEYTPKGKGYSAVPKVVTFETASRKGEPFEAMIQKLGIPSSAVPFCSTVLKNRTIRAYARSIGWKGYYTAIGIRGDELDRISKNYLKEKIIYPLVNTTHWPSIGQDIAKADVFKFWAGQPFDLAIDPDLGNCDNCWKKNLNLLVRNATRYPDTFTWWGDIETLYGFYNPRANGTTPPYKFFRGGLSTEDIYFLRDHASKEFIEKLAAEHRLNGCGESCEAF